MYYKFQPTAAIIRYTELLQTVSFYLLYLPTLDSIYMLGVQCRGVAYVMLLCYKMYYISTFSYFLNYKIL